MKEVRLLNVKSAADLAFNSPTPSPPSQNPAVRPGKFTVRPGKFWNLSAPGPVGSWI
jgi:hypothetical protein